jgi:hypothetical protein
MRQTSSNDAPAPLAARQVKAPASSDHLSGAVAAARSASVLELALTERIGRRVEVGFGRSRTLPVQLRRTPSGFRLRLHAFFAGAPEDVVDALATWVAHGRRNRGALARLDGWIDAALERLPARPARALALQPSGATHDLLALARELCTEGWLDDLERIPGITWGRTRGRARSSLQLGLFDPDAGTVRIHPVLDDPSVPPWFVRSVLFHELLHAAIPPRRDGNGRWVKHGPDFRRRERAYVDHARAEAWLASNIGRLIERVRRTWRGRRAT